MEPRSPNDALSIYRELAERYDSADQPSMRDRFLILAADAALAAGLVDEAERLRGRLLQASRHHMLRAYPSFAQAVNAPDVQVYIRDLRLNYPLDSARALLERLRGGNPAIPVSPPAPAAPAQEMPRKADEPAALPPTAPVIELPEVAVDSPAWGAAGERDPYQSARLPAPPVEKAPARRTTAPPPAAPPAAARRTELPAPAPPAPRRATQVGHREPAPAPAPPAPRPAPAPVARPATRMGRGPVLASEPIPPPPPTAALPPVSPPPAPPVQRPRPAVWEEPPQEEEPVTAPNGGAWLSVALGVITSLIGLAWAGYTLGRPFWPAG